MKKQLLSFATLVLVAFLAIAPKAADAQWVGYFSNGAFCLGPEIALPLGYVGGGVLIGANGELALTNAGTLGAGRLAVSFGLDYWSTTIDNTTYSYIPLRGLLNYHFVIPSSRSWDPYLGIGLGYAIVSATGVGAASSGLFVVVDAGTRYWFSPTVALRIQLGTGFGAADLGIGVDFELN